MPLDAVCLSALVRELEGAWWAPGWIKSISPPGTR